MMRRAVKADWSVIELAQKIQEEVRDSSNGNGVKGIVHHFKLIPKRGELYTYRLVAPDSAHNNEDSVKLWIDLGFQVHRQVPENAKGFRDGSIIQTEKKTSDYSIHAPKRSEGELFTYKAFVERVVDGDTMIVKIDLGFKTRIREYLRLRGIDAPELAAAEGKRTRDFVARELAKVNHVILTSYRSEKYGRYLADLFYGDEDKQYLNQKLLDEELATPFRELP